MKGVHFSVLCVLHEYALPTARCFLPVWIDCIRVYLGALHEGVCQCVASECTISALHDSRECIVSGCTSVRVA